jgi:hypothetical protein
VAGFNGSGTYIRPYSWQVDKSNGVDITASRFDTDGTDVATALSNCICKDGQQTTTEMIPFAEGLSFAAGTAMAPNLVVIGDTSTGFYQPSSGQLGFSSEGVAKVLFNANGIDNTPIGQGTAQIASFATTQITALTVSGISTLQNTVNVGANSGSSGIINLYGSSSGHQIVTVSSVVASGAKFQYPSSNGSANNVLITNGAGVTSWATPATGALVLLATVNASTASSVVFSSGNITNAYNKYVIEFDGVYGSIGGDLLLTVSANNGSTYGSSYSYFGSSQAGGSSTITGASGSSQSTYSLTNGAGSAIGGVSAVVSIGTIKFANPSAASICMFFTDFSQGGNAFFHSSGFSTNLTAINNIKIVPSAGNITGNFHLYGIQGT